MAGVTFRGPPRLVWWVRLCATLVCVLAVVALLGWVLGAWYLASLGTGLIPMAPCTATLLLLCAVAVLLRARSPSGRSASWVGSVLDLAVAASALTLLVLSCRGVFFEAEHLGFTIHDRPGEPPIGHMSPLTALGFLLASLSSLASRASPPAPPWRSVAARCLAGLVVGTSLVLIVAYLYGRPILSGGAGISPAVTTSLAFLALGAALFVLAAPRGLTTPRRPAAPDRRAASLLLVVFAGLTVGVVGAGNLYHRRTERQHLEQVGRELASIADLKVGDLVQWRKERLGDGAVFFGNSNFSGLARRVLDSLEDADARLRLQTWLGQVRDAYGYDRVDLLDSEGVPRVSVPDAPRPAMPHLIAEAQRSGGVTLVDLHRDSPGGPIRMSVLVPIGSETGGSQALGALVLDVDPERYLFPLVTRWPTPSRTAETFLLRRDGDKVVYLNQLRFKRDAALDLRVGLDRTEMPAVRAALGEQGIFEGRDYRDVPVLACLRAIPGSSWFMVARVDLDEVYAPLRRGLWELVGLVISLIVAAGSFVGLLWHRHTARYHEERERLAGQRQLALDAAHLGWWHYDPVTKVLRWDERYREIFGVTGYQRPNEEILARLHPEDLPSVWAAVEAALDPVDPRPYSSEYRVNLPDGSVRWVEAHGLATFEGDGDERHATSLVGTVEDVTEQKGAQERVRHLSEVLRAVRNVNQLITHEKNRDTLLRRACEILTETRGYQSAWIAVLDSTGELQAAAEAGIGDGFAEVRARLGSGEGAACCRDALTRSGVVVMHDTQLNCVGCPLAHTYRDTAALARRVHHAGRDYGVLVVALPSALADDVQEQALFGELAGDIGFALYAIEGDQERSRAEAALASLARRQDDLVQVVQRLAAARDEVAIMEVVRSAARRLTGADGATIVLRDGDECFYADEDAIQPLWKGRRFPMSGCASGWAMLHHQAVVVEDVSKESRAPVDLYRSTFVKSLALVPIRVAEPLGAIGVYWAQPHSLLPEEVQLLQMLADATAIALENSRLYLEMEERVRARTVDLETVNRELEAFSYSVSHDLRAPLRAIDGFTHMLVHGYEALLDSEARRICSVIRENAARMGQLIDDLLAFSRLGRAEMRLCRVDMGALASSVFEELTTPEGRERISFENRVDPDASAVGDPSMIRQVWTNLIGNAVKFSGRRVRAVVEVSGARQGGEIVYSVRDNGAGFEMRYAHKLFGVFQRLHRTGDFEGTGVGLALVQRVVQRHGGRVWAQGQLGEGATFFFALPCEMTAPFDRSPVQAGEVDDG